MCSERPSGPPTSRARSHTRSGVFVHVGLFPTDYYVATGIHVPWRNGASMDMIDTRAAPGRGPRGMWWRWPVVGVWAVTAVVALAELIRRPSLLAALCLAAAVASAVVFLWSRQTG